MDIAYGDIIGVQGDEWLSDSIRSATGNGPLSHVALCTATEPFVQVTEALNRVVTRSIDDRLADAKHVWVLKSPLSPDDRQTACRIALKHTAKDYAYANILWQGLDAALRTDWFTEHLTDLTSDVICSELVTICEQQLGLRSESATPNDLWGFWQVERWPIIQLK